SRRTRTGLQGFPRPTTRRRRPTAPAPAPPESPARAPRGRAGSRGPRRPGCPRRSRARSSGRRPARAAAPATRELVVLEVAHGPLVDVEMREERARPARVLAGDQIHFAQDAQRAQGDVLEVADRSRDDEERAAQATPTALALPRRAGAARGSG